jgi:hypothetical protein
MIPKTPNSRTLVVDGDTPIFRCAKALQKDYIEVNWNDFALDLDNRTQFIGGKLKGKEVKGKLNEINERHGISLTIDDFEITPKTVLIDAKNDDQRLAIGMKNIRSYIQGLLNIPWVKGIKWCLSSKTNFRKELNQDYKAQRPEKPKLLLQLKDLFIHEFKHMVTIKNSHEADDLLGIFGAWSREYHKNPKDSPYVLTGYDKDLLQIGDNWFLNFDKKEQGIFWIDNFTGHLNLCTQILQGDTADNLKGLPEITTEIKAKYGVATGGCAIGKSRKILSDCKTIDELYRTVEWCYKSFYGEDYKEHLNLMFRMVKLLENEGEIKDFPFQLEEE